MEWKEVNPEQSDWIRQIDIMAYYGSQKIGSIVLCDDCWEYVIDGAVYSLEADTEGDAKKEMIERLDEYFVEKIDLYSELRTSLEELSQLEEKAINNYRELRESLEKLSPKECWHKKQTK